MREICHREESTIDIGSWHRQELGFSDLACGSLEEDEIKRVGKAQ